MFSARFGLGLEFFPKLPIFQAFLRYRVRVSLATRQRHEGIRHSHSSEHFRLGSGGLVGVTNG